MPPEALEQALGGLGFDDPRLLAGSSGDFEDAAVIALPDGTGLVQTVDFFPPMVNDPFGFGRIAAANALSDVYAMGGQPLTAMNILCFPCKGVPLEAVREIMRGALEAVREAGAVPAGGHSVEDDSIKFGLAVSGTVNPARLATNRGAEPGDLLVLTKPIGTGVLINALKAKWDGFETLEDEIIKHCGRLNKEAGRCIPEHAILAATDVTGFGLGGHLLELAQASSVSMVLDLSQLPMLPRALELASMGLLPAGSIANREHYLPRCAVLGEPDPILLSMAFDAQTSGGLLLCVPETKLAAVQASLTDAGDQAQVIGRVQEQGEAFLTIR